MAAIPRGRPRAEPRAEQHQRIVAAARRAFADGGYDGVTLSSIAAAARVPRPVVAAGDYNATMGHPPLPAFLARTGMTDAHTRAGRGLARSWPSSRVLPPLGLLDRVLITPDISVVAIEEREVPGSDHLTVVSELALP